MNKCNWPARLYNEDNSNDPSKSVEKKGSNYMQIKTKIKTKKCCKMLQKLNRCLLYLKFRKLLVKMHVNNL